MKLTRRDAVAALAAIGATGGVALGVDRLGDRPEPSSDDEHVLAVMTAVAEVVYPDEVSGIDEFVDRFLEGRLDDSAHAAAIRDVIAELDRLARSWQGGPVDELSVDAIDTLLREVGTDTADEDPTGTTAERVRYYVVNELLLALYTSPKGGELVGIENPQGHPGGIESYRRGPP